jgi:hypothetical protein
MNTQNMALYMYNVLADLRMGWVFIRLALLLTTKSGKVCSSPRLNERIEVARLRKFYSDSIVKRQLRTTNC